MRASGGRGEGSGAGPPAPGGSIRPFEPEDAPGVISVIAAAYDGLGYSMDFDHFDSDLADIPGRYQDAGGAFWVLEHGGIVAGCVGVSVEGPERCELHRLYLSPSMRGLGWGGKLIDTALSWCRDAGCREVFLWSDIRFETAREVYVRKGFTPTQKTRAIDPVNPGSVERLFVKGPG